jgi:hypothetical protein
MESRGKFSVTGRSVSCHKVTVFQDSTFELGSLLEIQCSDSSNEYSGKNPPASQKKRSASIIRVADCSSTLEIAVVYSSETSINFYHNKWCHFPDESNLHLYCYIWLPKHRCKQSILFFPMARQPLGGIGRLIFRGFTITLLDKPHSVGLLWTRNQLVAETST